MSTSSDLRIGALESVSYIPMTTEVLQKLDLPQCPLRQDLLAEDICDLFYSNTFLGLIVGGGTMFKS